MGYRAFHIAFDISGIMITKDCFYAIGDAIMMLIVMEHLGIRIKQLLEERRWSQNELARRSGIVASYLSQIISGKIKNPRGDYVVAIAKALDITTDELYGLAPSRNDYDRKLINDIEVVCERTIKKYMDDFIEKAQNINTIETVKPDQPNNTKHDNNKRSI